MLAAWQKVWMLEETRIFHHASPLHRFGGIGIVAGVARGRVLMSHAPIAFSLIDPLTGIIEEHGHRLNGVSVAGRVLVFPKGCGSSSGSYVLLHLADSRAGPAALVSIQADAVTAAGAVLGRIPLVHRLNCDPLAEFHDDDLVEVDGSSGVVKLLSSRID
jgi:predicted aconitase with swiveling domain